MRIIRVPGFRCFDSGCQARVLLVGALRVSEKTDLQVPQLALSVACRVLRRDPPLLFSYFITPLFLAREIH